MTAADAPQPSSNPRNLAANLRHIANLIESADLAEFAKPVNLSVNISAFGGDAAAQMAAVDLVATLTGQEPTWSDDSGKYAYYRTEMRQGRAWSLSCYAFVRRPDPADELRAENERLRAELAAARAHADAEPVPA